MNQDNDDFRSRCSTAVLLAVLHAGRRNPDSGNTHVDVQLAVEGMAQAFSTFLTTVTAGGDLPPAAREMAADRLKDLGEMVVEQLAFFADRIRDGSFPGPEPKRPVLRVVD